MSWDALKNLDPGPEQEVTWGDYGRAAGSTVAGIGAGSAGLMRQMFEAGNQPEVARIFQGFQLGARNVGEDIESGMTEEGRARNAAGVTSDKFWEHPVSSIALKAVGMSPYLVAAAVPGALVGEGLAAMAATGGAAGWLAAGDVVDEITRKPDKMSDADLRATSPLYAGFRDGGTEEREARAQLNQIMVGAKPALAFLLGAGTGVFGGAGNVVRRLGTEEAAQTIGKVGAAKGANFLGQRGIGAAAAEGAATEFAEEGYGGYAAQQADIQAGLRKDYDASEIFDRALTGAVLGGGFGAVSGIGAGKGKAKADEIKANRAREEGAELQAEAGAAGESIQAETASAARSKIAASKKGLTVVDAGEVAPDEALAVRDMQQPTQPSPAAVPTPPPTPSVQNVPPPPASGVAQPQQPPAGPPAGVAAAPVTPEVTPPVTPEVTPDAKPVLTDRMLTDLARRGIAPEEAAQLTRQQIAEVMNLPVGGAMPAAPSTDVSARSRATEPSPVDEVATAPGVTQAAQPPEPSPVDEVATAPKTNAKGGRILPSLTPEAQANVAATTAAANATTAADVKAQAKAAKAAKGPGKKNWLPHEVQAHKERHEASTATYEKYRPKKDEAGAVISGEELTVPTKPAERKALAERLQDILTIAGWSCARTSTSASGSTSRRRRQESVRLPAYEGERKGRDRPAPQKYSRASISRYPE